MSLAQFQTAMGVLVRHLGARGAGEREAFAPELAGVVPEGRDGACLVRLAASPGFAFVAKVQRSWCERRASAGARLTLALLDPERRREVLDAWLGVGGGTGSFAAAEAESFLHFLAPRLPARSHQRSVCGFELAVYRAFRASSSFVAPAAESGDGDRLSTGAGAALVTFHAPPALVLEAARQGTPPPPFEPRAYALLLAPSLPQLWRVASDEESALWRICLGGASRARLLAGGHREDVLAALLRVGALVLRAG